MIRSFLAFSVLMGSLWPSLSPAQTPPALAMNKQATGSAKKGLLHGRYQVLGDGSEIKDVQTGLVWRRCSQGQKWVGNTCALAAIQFTFADAQKLAGNGWRVPTIRELASLIYCSSGKTIDRDDPEDGMLPFANDCAGESQRPTIREQAFPETVPAYYWSSSPDVGNANEAWFVHFENGDATRFDRGHRLYVRLVRANQ